MNKPTAGEATQQDEGLAEGPMEIDDFNWPDDETNRCRSCYGIGCPNCFDTGREDLDHEVELMARDRWRTGR
jgi:hypothetical protein